MHARSCIAVPGSLVELGPGGLVELGPGSLVELGPGSLVELGPGCLVELGAVGTAAQYIKRLATRAAMSTCTYISLHDQIIYMH